MYDLAACAMHRCWLDMRQSAEVLLGVAFMQGRESWTQVMAVSHTVSIQRYIYCVSSSPCRRAIAHPCGWDYFRLELTYVERLLARRRVLGLKGADGAVP